MGKTVPEDLIRSAGGGLDRLPFLQNIFASFSKVSFSLISKRKPFFTMVDIDSSSLSSEEHEHPDFLEGVSHDMLYRFVFIILVHGILFAGFSLYRKYSPAFPATSDPVQHKLFEYNDPRLNQPPQTQQPAVETSGKSSGVQFSEGASLRRR